MERRLAANFRLPSKGGGAKLSKKIDAVFELSSICFAVQRQGIGSILSMYYAEAVNHNFR